MDHAKVGDVFLRIDVKSHGVWKHRAGEGGLYI